MSTKKFQHNLLVQYELLVMKQLQELCCYPLIFLDLKIILNLGNSSKLFLYLFLLSKKASDRLTPPQNSMYPSAMVLKLWHFCIKIATSCTKACNLWRVRNFLNWETFLTKRELCCMFRNDRQMAENANV